MLDGKKTFLGAVLLAATFFVGGIEPLLGAQAVVIIKTITGTLGTFLGVYGIGHKIEKSGS